MRLALRRNEFATKVGSGKALLLNQQHAKTALGQVDRCATSRWTRAGNNHVVDVFTIRHGIHNPASLCRSVIVNVGNGRKPNARDLLVSSSSLEHKPEREMPCHQEILETGTLC